MRFIKSLLQIIEENKIVACIAAVLLLIGFIIGATNEKVSNVIWQSTRESARSIDPEDIESTAVFIFVQNFGVTTRTVMDGALIFRLPILVEKAVINMGAVFGVSASYDLLFFLIDMAEFGVLELLGAFCSVMAGLLFSKALLELIFYLDIRRLILTVWSSMLLLLYSWIALIPSAILEAAYIYSLYYNPSIILYIALLGICATLVYVNIHHIMRIIARIFRWFYYL